ncbi:MAG: ABC-ATPase domain-containing protein [Candidatus Desulfofervidaceae bacterium]|nr:ABC-ATPase domain-containing protein [Candidatus Desulfofervidaceae bacterium]
MGNELVPKDIAYIRRVLKRINARGYRAYKDLEGVYQFPWFRLAIDHVQADPFATPSRFTIIVSLEKTGLPAHLWANKRRIVALTDFLARTFQKHLHPFSRPCGTGHSGKIAIQAGSQVILERNSIAIKPPFLEVRFTVGLPASGRSILGEKAEKIICEYLPCIAEKSLLYQHLPSKTLEEHVFSYEDQEILRSQLKQLNLVAFIPNGAILPRKSGVEDTPLPTAIPFMAPKEAEVTVKLPYKGEIKGMGIPEGITLIVGGGFHGKSTLLKAIQEGIYSHIPGDGREYVVSLADTIKIKAEDGRRIEKVDISPFINNLPFQKDTRTFSTENASGSTSQAANIMEAIEVGTHLLLLDEDTSATNFMVRDKRMQALVSKDEEPITPFLDRVKELYTCLGISTILVMGGCGDYLDVADHVIMMSAYRPLIVTQKAKEIASKYQTGRKPEAAQPLYIPSPRRPVGEIDSRRGGKVKITAKGNQHLILGRETVDVSANEQIKETGQLLAIGHVLHYYAWHYLRTASSLKEGLEMVEKDIDKNGLDVLLPHRAGNLARPRLQEMAFTLNRLRSLKIQSK